MATACSFPSEGGIALYDLLISGGHVLDPSQGLDGPADVALSGGRVAAVSEHIDPSLASSLIDATGSYVTPGLIDLHAHGYWGVSHYGIDLDRYSLGRGVTTVLDPGSAGAQTWPGFLHHVIERAECRIYALLNISMAGMIAQQVGECEELRYLDPDIAASTVAAYPDRLLGIKVRLSRNVVGNSGLEPLHRALAAARASGVPLTAHVGDTPGPLEEILSLLRPGDTLTHCFHGRPHSILDGDGRLLPAVWDAVERGVTLDVGHGVGSFAFATAERALDQGLLPHVISSDLHSHSVPMPAVDLVTTMSKFLLLGMSLHEVVRRTTVIPAEKLGMTDRLGTLRPGAEGDVTVLRLETGSFRFLDCVGEERTGHERLEPVAVVTGGKQRAIIPAAS